MPFALKLMVIAVMSGWVLWVWRGCAPSRSTNLAPWLWWKRGRRREGLEDPSGPTSNSSAKADGSPTSDGFETRGQTLGVTDSWGALDPVMSDSVGLTDFTGSGSSSHGSSFNSGVGLGSGCGFNDW